MQKLSSNHMRCVLQLALLRNFILVFVVFKIQIKCDSSDILVETKECRVSEIRPADYVIVTHSKGKFLAYVTQSKQKNGKLLIFEF